MKKTAEELAMVGLKIELPEDFLEEELRCGYWVTTEMKKVWAVELDLLNELQRVCKKHEIQYFADGGTVLGAVRHQGFIPWDDDIDIAMTRENYENLCLVAAEEFHEPYFFQTEYTDRGSLRGHAQLRNSLTTAILEGEEFLDINHGIFIDIFPLDAVTDNVAEFEKQRQEIKKLKKKIFQIANCTDRYNPYDVGKKRLLKKIIHYFSPIIIMMMDYDNLYRKYEKICQKHNTEKSEYVSLLSFHSDWDRLIRRRKDYDEYTHMNFEFMKIPVMACYEDILTRLYGDWSIPVKGTSAHGKPFFDVEHPYTDYVNH